MVLIKKFESQNSDVHVFNNQRNYVFNPQPFHPYNYIFYDYYYAVYFNNWVQYHLQRSAQLQQQQQQQKLIPIQENQIHQSGIDRDQLLSFLKFDDSFLTPWNNQGGTSSTNGKYDKNNGYMEFDSGSVFSYDCTMTWQGKQCESTGKDGNYESVEGFPEHLLSLVISVLDE